MSKTSGRSSFSLARKRKKRRRFRRRFLLKLFLLLFFLAFLGGLLAVYLRIQPLLANLPSPEDLTTGNERFSVATQIFDRHGTKLYELYDDERRIPVKLETLPAYVGQAAIAIEDKKFYSHLGFDPLGIVRAFIVNQTRGELAQGGSTITQQLIKKALLTDDKSYDRKIQEIALSVIAERRYSKNEILEMYLNFISYGGTAVGIGSAAETYFAKSAPDLTLAEAALLAGLPQAPSRYSPFQSDATAAKNRQQEVLKNMVELKFITQSDADAAFAEPLIYTRKRIDIYAPHFVFYVRDLLIERFGADKVLRGGLRVTTTLDLKLQNDAEATLAAELAALEKLQVGNGAALITKPNTGEILAMVGSKDYYNEEQDGQVNITTSLRQPGSSIKPLVYATAFEQKMLSPGSVWLDVPTCFQIIGQSDYCPRNYSGNFNGPLTVRNAIGSSLNIPAVKTLRMIGLESFMDQAQALGISTWLDPKNYGWSLALGGGEVKMVDMAVAFGTFANQGVTVPLTPFLKVEDYQGAVLLDFQDTQRRQLLAGLQANPKAAFEKTRDGYQLRRTLQPEPAYLINDILRDDRARYLGFGPRSMLVIKDKDVAVKTGTTNDMRDNWSIGYTPEFLTAIWVGNTDSTPMNSRLVSGITGAAPIWHEIMTWLLAEQETTWPEQPETIAQGSVCWTGVPQREVDQLLDEAGNPLSPSGCGDPKTDLYWKATAPTRSNVRTEATFICAETGMPPVTDPETGETAACGEQSAGDYKIAQDPFLNYYCLDCPRLTDENGKRIFEAPYRISEADSPRQYGD